MDKSPASLPGWLVVITCLLLALAVRISAGHADAPQDLARQPQHAPPALSPLPGRMAMPKEAFGCRSLDSLQRMTQYFVDNEARAIGAMFVSGQCEVIAAGQAVYVLDYRFLWSESVTIRKHGATYTLETYQSYVPDQK